VTARPPVTVPPRRRRHRRAPDQADADVNLDAPAPGTPGGHYFEGWRSSPTCPEERRKWFIKNHNFFIE
jgi:hypothetical protein